MTSDDFQTETPVHDHNRRAWDARVRRKSTFTRPVEESDFADPLAAVDGVGWLGGNIRDRQVLCLAAGGARQGPLYAAAGARVTVVDISPSMLELDRQIAAEKELQIHTIQASMDNLSALETGSFDIVIQPVSTCYLPHVWPVYQEVARVIRDQGLYISQHKQPASLQAGVQPSDHGYELLEPYYRDGPLPQVAGSPHREEGTLEYLHRWEELIGGMCRAGFVIEDLLEPFHAKPDAEVDSFAHRCQFIAPYLRVKARRVDESDANGPTLWTPELDTPENP